MNSSSLHILVVDDHAMVREAVRVILASARHTWFVTEAVSGEDALDVLRSHRADVVVTDLSMPGLCGCELIRRLHAGWPQSRILVLSMHADSALAAAALRAGALGYLAKEQGGRELVDAVLAVSQDRCYLGQNIAERAVEQYREREHGLDRLSTREREIFQLIVQGGSSSGIAGELCLSVKTVSAYKRRILDKLALDSTAALVSLGVRSGIADTRA